jgi:flagella basal body P-ring formation protein FlgA
MLYRIVCLFSSLTVVCAEEDLMVKFKEMIQQQQQLSGDFDVSLDNQGVLNTLNSDNCRIQNLSITQDAQRFSAQIIDVSKEDEKKNRTIPVSGKIQLLISVPVLARPIAVGEVLSEADFVWQKLPISRVNQACYMTVADMVGKSPSMRVLTPGQPILKNDIKSPILVKRNTNIRLYYRTPGLELSRVAEAQQDGARGDIIRFMVAENKRIINARVVSENEAEIML